MRPGIAVEARTQIRTRPEEALWQGQAGSARTRTRAVSQCAPPRACPAMKPVREPDAGDPQVRFDERRRETEPRTRLRHRHQGESRRQQRLPRPTATAPAVDSTLNPEPHQWNLINQPHPSSSIPHPSRMGHLNLSVAVTSSCTISTS